MYSFLFETTTIVPFEKLKLLEESKTSDGAPKIAFKSRLQEANLRNANNRIYKSNICESIVNTLKPKASSRSLYSEIDHPMFFEGNTSPDLMKKRAMITELKNCGCLIRDITFENDIISGEIQTLSGLTLSPFI